MVGASPLGGTNITDLIPPSLSPGVRNVTAIVLAGERPGGETLVAASGQDVSSKALLRVGGEAMLGRVVRALLASATIGEIVIVAQRAASLADGFDISWLADERRVRFLDAGASVSGAVLAAAPADGGGFPYLVTTADHPLLDPEMIETFLAGARSSGADIAMGLVERRVFRTRFPIARRTWLRFRGGAYSGANLFYLARPKARQAVAFWQRIEQRRKRSRAIIAAFGPVLLFAAALRLIGLETAIRLGGRRLGVTAAPVLMPRAEACIDVDKPADLALAERLLAARPAP